VVKNQINKISKMFFYAGKAFCIFQIAKPRLRMKSMTTSNDPDLTEYIIFSTAFHLTQFLMLIICIIECFPIFTYENMQHCVVETHARQVQNGRRRKRLWKMLLQPKSPQRNIQKRFSFFVFTRGCRPNKPNQAIFMKQERWSWVGFIGANIKQFHANQSWSAGTPKKTC